MINTILVTEALNAAQITANGVQNGLVFVMEQCRALSKKDVLESQELAAVFAHKMPGIDRGSLVAWFQAFTPVRIKFKDNGQFERLGWSAQYIKECRESGKLVWNVEGAKAASWYDFDPERTRKTSRGKLETALAALAREVAKLGIEDGDISKYVQEAVEMVKDDLAFRVAEVQGTQKFNDWWEARQKDIAKEARATA